LDDLGHDVSVLIESEDDVAARAVELMPEVAVISRPGLFARLESQLRPLGVPLIYWAHDLHFVRLGLQARFDGGLSTQAARVMRMVEEECFTRADLAVLPTAEEAERARQEFPGSHTLATPYFSMPELPLRQRAPEGGRIVFIGGEHHAPNRDGLDWFLSEVWPRLPDHNPSTELIVVGAWHRAAPWPAGVQYTGVIAERQVDALLHSARVGIAPLRFGAGMKRKTLHYLSHGVPVVGTDIAVEGLEASGEGQVAGVLRATSVDEWVAAIGSLGNDDLWLGQALAGQTYVRRAFSAARFRDGITAVLGAALAPD
jgi:glycosyltransferase involved in cell wall biosynthesis